MRTFLAILPSSDVLENLERAQKDLGEAGADVRWVAPAAIHLTIQFLGEVPEGEISAIERALAERLHAQVSFEVECRGLGVFPNWKKPRVVWAGLHGEGLDDLAERVERVLAPIGFPPEERDFEPHVTLGRIRSPRGCERLLARIRESAGRSFGSFPVEQAILYKSDLRPDRAVYTPIATFSFQGR